MIPAFEVSPSVVVIDDHPLLSDGICAAMQEIGFVATQLDPAPFLSFDAQAWSASAVPAVDCAIVDLSMGDAADAGVQFLVWLVAAGIQTVILTGVQEQDRLDACLAKGAAGVLSKSMGIPDIVEAVRSMANGGQLCSAADRADAESRSQATEMRRQEDAARFGSLSIRERAVLEMLMQGSNVSAIAEHSFVAESTVRSQIKSVFRKLSVSSQLEAVVLANSVGFAADSDPS